MTIKKLKVIAFAVIAIPTLCFAGYNSTAVSAVAVEQDDVAVMYRKNACMACHKKDASKWFDQTKSDEAHVEVILKGTPGPPKMKGYEDKITPEQAAALVTHMRNLANPDS